MEKKQPLIFIHIPKTGGSTLHKIIQRQYKKDELHSVWRPSQAEEYFEQDAAAREKIVLLKGHMPFGYHKAFKEPQSVKYFTMVRDPIDRVISLYFYILTRPKHPLYAELLEKKYSLKQFVDTAKIQQTDNAQVRMLSGDIHLPFGEVTRQTLEKAKANIEQRFLVAATDKQYDPFLILLQHHLNWGMLYYANANVNSKRRQKAEIDDQTLAVIQQQNTLDSELFAFVKQRFEKQWEEVKEVLEPKLKKFQKRNPKAAKLIRLKRRLFR